MTNTMGFRGARALLAGVALCGLAACADDITVPAIELVRVQLATGSPVPRAGGPIRVVLQNDSRQGIGYNLCTDTKVQRLDGTRWVDQPPDGRACSTSLALLSAGQRIEVTYDLPRGLTAGRYRLAVTLYPDAGSNGVVYLSEPFDVAP
jgi:hypothetical protein